MTPRAADLFAWEPRRLARHRTRFATIVAVTILMLLDGNQALAATPSPPRLASLSAKLVPLQAAPCTQYSTGFSVCGAIRDHYNALGGPSGPLGNPTSNEITTPDGIGRFNSFQNASDHIYWTPTTGAWEVGGVIFVRWGQLGYERSSLGYPVTDETANPGTFARFGARRSFFQQGAIYFDGNTHVGQYAPWSPATAAATPGAVRPNTLEPNGCPTGTTNYPAPKDPYSCIRVVTDTTGYPAGIRKGFSNHAGSPSSDEGALPSSGFGAAHANDDHNVGSTAQLLLLLDGIPYPSRTAAPALKRVVYTEVFQIDGTNVDAISVVVQKRNDSENRAPDNYDFGLVTGYCNTGVPNVNNYQGFCPTDLPPPFGQASGTVGG